MKKRIKDTCFSSTNGSGGIKGKEEKSTLEKAPWKMPWFYNCCLKVRSDGSVPSFSNKTISKMCCTIGNI